MKLPLNKFSKWVHWSERHTLEDLLVNPGVYLLGQFSTKPSARPNLNQPLIYIGETCTQTLSKRLYQFNRSAFEDKFAHSGGKTFRRKYNITRVPSWLYVSVLSVPQDDISSNYIRFIERALIWEHVRRHKRKGPKCNVK